MEIKLDQGRGRKQEDVLKDLSFSFSKNKQNLILGSGNTKEKLVADILEEEIYEISEFFEYDMIKMTELETHTMRET